MAYGTLTFFSNVLGKDMQVDYLLPDTRRRFRSWSDWEDRKLPTIWVLHGNGDASNAWIRKSTIELYARQFDVAVIMPNGAREAYTDSKRGMRYFTYVSEELPMVMRNYLPLSRKREENFVMGNSMGGYGALKLALTHPDRYAAAASFSGAVDFSGELEHLDRSIMGDTLGHIFGSAEEFVGSENDLYALADALAEKEHGEDLRIFQCCGTDDFLYGLNADYRKHLEGLLPAERYSYHEAPGGHDWFFWNPETARAFRFFGFAAQDGWDDSGLYRDKN